MGAIERFIQRTIEEQRRHPKRRNDGDDLAVIREASRAAKEALRDGCDEVQLDIWYE